MDFLPNYQDTDWKHVLEPLNFAEAARRLAASSKNTVLDDVVANQFADQLQAMIVSFLTKSPPTPENVKNTFALLLDGKAAS